MGSDANYIFEYDIKSSKLINYELPTRFLEVDKLNNNVSIRRKVIYNFTQKQNTLICGSDGGLLFFDIEKKSFNNVFSFDEKNRYNNRIKCFVNIPDANKLMFGTWGGLVKLNLSNYSYTIESISS